MKTNKIIGAVLIAVALLSGYMGINKLSNSSAGMEVMDMKIGVKDTSGQQQGYIYLGLGVVLLAGGLYVLNKKG